MTHEFKDIIEKALLSKKQGIKSVLASVVALDGSSYRGPGVRMLILENGGMVGAVSGGCVEKEILRQSGSVFETGKAKIMTYDGRYRLGCEGVLYILLELFNPDETLENAFYQCLKSRRTFHLSSYYTKQEGVASGIGTVLKIDDIDYSVSGIRPGTGRLLSVFKQEMLPCFKLVIVGAEHDAVQLCKYAALTGWEVTIVSGFKESKSIENFPGAHAFFAMLPEDINGISIDNQTAIVLMTHSFANDLRYLVALKDRNPNYIGILGPTRRREDLLSQLIGYCPDVDNVFLDQIYGPSGIDIGSETPQEIAISIVAEILAVTRKRDVLSLSKKSGKIHSK